MNIIPNIPHRVTRHYKWSDGYTVTPIYRKLEFINRRYRYRWLCIRSDNENMWIPESRLRPILNIAKGGVLDV